MAIRIGKPAPDFTANAYVRGKDKPQPLALKDFKGKWLALVFYPRDFSAVCPTELEAFGKMAREFEQEKCSVVALSTDSWYSHKNWFETDPRLAGADFPVVADTTHEISRVYDALNEAEGSSIRSVFIIDDQGILVYQAQAVGRWGFDVNDLLTTLRGLRTGKLCPTNWKPGEKTIN